MKYLELKQKAGSLYDKVFIKIFHEIKNIESLLDESLLCSKEKKINLDNIKSEIRELFNNIALKKEVEINIKLISTINISFETIINSIKNKCNNETIETIKVKYNYIIEELYKINSQQ
jgi:hypothetical protein